MVSRRRSLRPGRGLRGRIGGWCSVLRPKDVPISQSVLCRQPARLCSNLPYVVAGMERCFWGCVPRIAHELAQSVQQARRRLGTLPRTDGAMHHEALRSTQRYMSPNVRDRGHGSRDGALDRFGGPDVYLYRQGLDPKR